MSMRPLRKVEIRRLFEAAERRYPRQADLAFLLQSLDDPTTIGTKMSIALVTTFYGAVMANLVFLPLAQKLRKRSSEELLFREMTLAGILSIQSGDVPRIVEQKLNTFLPPGERQTQFQ